MYEPRHIPTVSTENYAKLINFQCMPPRKVPKMFSTFLLSLSLALAPLDEVGEFSAGFQRAGLSDYQGGKKGKFLEVTGYSTLFLAQRRSKGI